MKQISKHIAIFLALTLLSNSLLAAQMNVSMAKSLQQNIHSQNQLHCHTDKPNTAVKKVLDCCQYNCSACILASNLNAAAGKIIFPSGLAPILATTINKHLLPAHKHNLYKPPIIS